MRKDELIQVGDLAARPGERVRGFLDIGETATGPIQIPLVLINGRERGPVLCLTAGVHATEYPAIDALMRLLGELRPQEMSGAVLAVPVVNMHMFESRSGFVSPIDGLNLNKIAPGAESGSLSEVLAWRLFHDVILKARYHIDLHGGDLGEMLLPFAGYAMSGDPERDREGEALARLYSPELVALYRDGTALPPNAGYLTLEASRKGVVSILAEAGSNGSLEEADVEVHLAGLRNVMRYLRMIEGEPRFSRPRRMATTRFLMRARRAGLVRLKVMPGDQVAAGQEIAEIRNVFGDLVEVIRSPDAGTAGLVWAHRVVNTGDPIVRCWATVAAPPFPETDRFMAAA